VVNARSKKAGIMVGLRRSLWPMMGGGKTWTALGDANAPMMLNKLTCKSIQ
jgi:hypothetical protein